jgi:hypothetical protein
MSAIICVFACFCMPFYVRFRFVWGRTKCNSFAQVRYFGSDKGAFDIERLDNNSKVTDVFMGMTAYNAVASANSPGSSLTAFFGLCSMIIVCGFIIFRGLSDEKKTLALNIARNVREQSVSMRTIFLKNLVHDYRILKSDSKFKQLLMQHIGPLRDQLLESHLVFYQDDLVQITNRRDALIAKLRDIGEFEPSFSNLSQIDVTPESTGSSVVGADTLIERSATEKLSAELFKLNQDIIARQKIRRSCTGSAFVTFRSTDAALKFLRHHVMNHNLGGSSSTPEVEDKYEKCASEGIFAPEPGDIRWKYVGTTTATRRLYQARNYLFFMLFLIVAVFVGFASILMQFFAIPKLIAAFVLKGDGWSNKPDVSSIRFEILSQALSILSSIFMTIASRILPGLVISIGDSFPTVSNRDNVTNNYWRILVVLWTVYCVAPIVALYSFRWMFTVEACPQDWQNSMRVLFTFKMMLSFSTVSIVLDYMCIGLKVDRIIKLRKKYQAKRNAAKSSGDQAAALQPLPSFLQLLPIVFITEDRSEPFEELLSYSINSVMFILNFTVSFFYPQCSFLGLLYFVLKYYLDKYYSPPVILHVSVCFHAHRMLLRYQLVYLFKPTSRRHLPNCFMS